jgi:hypothetical protein
MTRRALAVPLLLALLASSAPAEEDETAIATILVYSEAAPGRRVPVSGARVSCWTEDVRPTALASRLVAETKTDAFGLAELRVPARESFHWMVDADGWGIHHEYGGAGTVDGECVTLTERGTDRRVRVLGPFGRPLAGARIEMLLGCPHSPAARVATTDADGYATLPNVVDSGWELWIVAPGVKPRSYALPEPTTNGAPPVILTDPGGTATGVVLDAQGKPVEGAVVRELDGFRGPVTATAADGTFTLHGLSGKAEIGVFVPGSPHGRRPDAVARAFTEGVPLRFRLREDRPTSLGDGEGRHRLDLVLEKTGSFVPLRFVRLSDGLTLTRESGLWPNSVDLPPGDWRITAGGGFSYEAAVTVEALVPTPNAVPLVLKMGTNQGAFGVRPDAVARAKTGKGRLRIAGFEKEIRLDGIEWLAPDVGAALVLTEPYGRTVPVPANEKGQRFLELPPPEENVVRFRLVDLHGKPVGFSYEADATVEVEPGEDGAWILRTHRVGDLALTLEATGHLLGELEIVLPMPPSETDLGTVVLRPETDLVARTFHVLRADGSPAPGAHFVPVDERTGEVEWGEAGEMSVQISEDVPVELRVEGHLPLPVVLTRGGPTVLRLPAGRLAIRVQGAKGEPVEADVWVDGWPVEDLDEDDEHEIEGVPDGKHMLIVTAEGHRTATIAVDLKKGERRSLVVRLAPRVR